MFISLQSFMKMRALQGGLPKFEKKQQNFILGNSVFTGKMPTLRNKTNFFRKNFSNENSTSFIYFVERNPLRSISVIFVEHIFFWTHCRVLPVWVGDSKCALKFGHARRLGHFTREITLNNAYLSQFLPDRKVLWMTLEQLFEIFIKLKPSTT